VRLVRLLVLIVVAAAVAGGGLWSLQRRLIYLPDEHQSPARFECSDGLNLGGWFRPPRPAAPVVHPVDLNAPVVRSVEWLADSAMVSGMLPKRPGSP